MKRQYMRAVCAAFAFAALACAGDPTKALRTGPFLLSLQPTLTFVDLGKTVSLVVVARDEQLNPVPLTITATAANPAIATVEVDTARHFPDGATQGFLVTGVSLQHTKVTVTGGGLTDSVVVDVLPLVFDATFSTTTPKGGDTLTIRASTLFKFDPDSATASFAVDKEGPVVFASAESIKVLTPFSNPGAVNIGGIVVTYAPGLELTRKTSTSVTQTGDFWAKDSSWQTAPDITPLLPAAGKSSLVIAGAGPLNGPDICPEGSDGPCIMFKFTLADTATFAFSTDWEGAALAPDVDIYACSDSTVANFGDACFEDGGGGATAVKPQTTGNHTYPAGTHYFVIETFGNPSKNYRTTIARPAS